MKRTLAASAAFLLTLPLDVRVLAQNRMNFPWSSQDSGHVALGLALRKLNVSGTFMQTAAHPDDEHNALFAMFTHGMGLRSIDVQTNRGEGGQNEIGPELFRDIGVLRTSELLSAHRIDGAEQYFTRAIDYGYSFDPQEVIDKWGRKEIVGDFVRLIRTLRPDVVLTMNIQGRGGDRAHEADHHSDAAKPIARPAIRRMYPEQIQRRPAAVAAEEALLHRRLRRSRRRRTRRTWRRSASSRHPAVKLAPRRTPRMYDPLLGRTYAEIGTDARSNHKCQGTSGLPPLPGIASGRGGGRGRRRISSSRRTIPGQMERTKRRCSTASIPVWRRWRSLPVRIRRRPDAPGWRRSSIRRSRRRRPSMPATTPAPPLPSKPASPPCARFARSSARSGLSDSARYEIDFRLEDQGTRLSRTPCSPPMDSPSTRWPTTDW